VPRVWRAAPDEAPAVARLLVAFRDWYGKSEPPAEEFRASVRRLMDDPSTEYLLGGGEPPSGVLQLRFRWSVWTSAEDSWVEDVYVDEAARGSGLGRALVEAACERARARGCKRIELDVDEGNAAARALYESLGFSSGKRPGQLSLFMARQLD
jgi:GNAT superfamily N-acetyltransferase